MTVQDIIDYANEGELNQLDVGAPQLIRFINLAVVELHTRFRLLVKEVSLATTANTTLYTVTTADLSQILTVTDSTGKPCVLNNAEYVTAINEQIGSGIYVSENISPYVINTMSYNQLQILNPAVDTLKVLYSALPTRLTTSLDVIPVPEIMSEAILHYIGYRAHGSYNADIKTENNTHYMRFEASCKKLKDLGYAPVVTIDKIDTRNKGYL